MQVQLEGQVQEREVKGGRQTTGLVLALAVLGVIVSLKVTPGVFINDDNSYVVNVLALRQGRVTVPGTEGLPPSRELLAFDPAPRSRSVDRTPVASVAPPLYAPIALPFSLAGWRGLVALNTLSYLVTIGLVFAYTRRHAVDPHVAWLAAGAFAFGGHVLEYAQGLWPHALSIFLCTAGVMAAGRVVDGGRVRYAAAAGLLLGLATGVRYQNAAILAAVGGATVLWSHRRRVAVPAFVLAALLPLTASSAMNHARLGSWNPVSKGPGYLSVALVDDESTRLVDPFVMLYALVVDYSARPTLSAGNDWVARDPSTGAHLILGITVKKALLQSAPWAALCFLWMLTAWLRPSALSAGQARQLRLMSAVTAAVLAVFALAGVRRHDGLAFNQRYLLELLPLAAVALAWAVDGWRIRYRPILLGTTVGAGLAAAVLLGTPLGGDTDALPVFLRRLALLKVPLALALSVCLAWWVARRRQAARPLALGLIGVSLGWAFIVHVGDDVAAATALRRRHLAITEALARALPDRAALITYSGYKIPAVPLLFDRDLVVLDVSIDEGKDAPMLIEALLARNRRVFLLLEGMPTHVVGRVLDKFEGVGGRSPDLRLIEVRPSVSAS